VIVNGADSEARYRAMGYLRFGEPRAQVDHYEYPKVLRHPEHQEAIPAQTEAKIENNRIVGTFTVPPVAAVFPDIFVKDVNEENLWRDKGYKPAGEYDKAALEAVLNGTIDEEEYEAAEFPKWIDGELITHDPA